MRRLLKKSIVAVILVITSALSLPCASAQSAEDDVSIDPALISKDRITVDCDFSTYAKAQDCARRVLPSVQYKLYSYVGSQTTFLLRVVYKDYPLPSDATKRVESVGSAFLVDRKHGYFLTAKHVVMGPKAWSTEPRFQGHSFVDLETAIEDYLGPSQVTMTLQIGEDFESVPVALIALDRNSDLALLQVSDQNLIRLSQFTELYNELPMSSAAQCTGGVDVTAVGFSKSAASQKMERQIAKFGVADCRVFPQTYYIGGQKYRVPLMSTTTKFEPGFSGGPVLDNRLHLYGVVSGATMATGTAGTTSFFVPQTEIESFLSRFR